MKLLFVCNQNMHRSKTAEDLYKNIHEVRSAGLYNNNVTSVDLDWADIIFVMEDHQRAEIGKRFPSHYLSKTIISLGIPDIFSRGDPILMKKLESVKYHLK